MRYQPPIGDEPTIDTDEPSGGSRCGRPMRKHGTSANTLAAAVTLTSPFGRNG